MKWYINISLYSFVTTCAFNNLSTTHFGAQQHTTRLVFFSMSTTKEFEDEREDPMDESDLSSASDDAADESEEEEEEVGQVDENEFVKLQNDRLTQVRQGQKEKLAALRAEYKKKLKSTDENAIKDRFKYLLQQTELYTSMMAQPLPTYNNASKKQDKTGTLRKSMKEEVEDQEILREALEDENDPANLTHNVRMTVSPSYIKDTLLRNYQLEGLNWLIKLNENGINGILADEMGMFKNY